MPWFIPLIAIAGTVGGTAMAVQGQRQQAKSQRAMQKHNAATATVKAQEEEQARRIDISRKRRETKRLASARNASVGASGLTQEGSPLEVALDSAELEALDTVTIGYNRDLAAKRARGEAQLSLAGADATRQAGRIGVGQSLFSGGIQTVKQANDFNKAR